ncbi:glutathione S-transferase family protein [Roseibium salinum]|uniref:Glutathione S-transferase n=1 Tax=Roseibium salinum TaxID=1604349 RepID=A0ABT3QZC6_9HYPH|nr:glutathione S-transferase [Roseibium sp. DSM 29163]MCX2722180.1 glutathione S-transferase [Roseibium sp. DSM 29163]
MSSAIRIYTFPLSGHGHRVELFANLIGVNHECITVDLPNGEHKKEPFLKLNPAGKIPAIEDGSVVLADSNAILVYLARKYAPDWIPADIVGEAQVQRFLSLAANEIANGPAAARLTTVFGAQLDAERAKSIAKYAFDILESHLSGRAWLVGEKPSIADVAIYTYTAHAPEGNVSLDPYPNIRAFLARVEALPGFVPMQATKVGLAA